VEGGALDALLRDEVLAQLRALGAGITMGLTDLSGERAGAVKRLEAAQVPVDAWLLLPRGEGYFATLDNAPQVAARYDAFRDWSAAHGLSFGAVGLDFEPDLAELDALLAHPARQLAKWAWRARDRARLARALDAYRALAARIRADGYRLETYQVALLHADRARGGTLFQRLFGAVDLEADREVVMLYSSLFGAGFLAAWAPSCRAIGLGSTGGGVDPLPKLSFEALARDLALARRYTQDVSIFSLEGCVEAGFLARLADEVPPVPLPARHRLAGGAVRTAALWAARLWG